MQENNITAGEIVSSFNTWKFKREQPSDLEKLNEFVQTSIDKNEPIKFLMYWGKGDKDEIGEAEKQSFDFLEEFFGQIKDKYSYGVEVKIIFTDTHARINGYDEKSINSYCSSVADYAKNYGYEVVLLSEYADYDEDKLSSGAKSLEINDFIKALEGMSKKHYKTSDDFEYAAKIYFLQNQIEKQVLEEDFPDYIFLTFNSSDFNNLFPEKLPIFYMYSLEKGTSAKPWFI